MTPARVRVYRAIARPRALTSLPASTSWRQRWRAQQLRYINRHTPQVTCTGGYAKPAWQTGTGVPNDGVRDIPDVSLFAGDGS